MIRSGVQAMSGKSGGFAVFAAAVFVVAGAGWAPAAPPLAEDVDFGCGLVSKRFYDLGIEVLEGAADRVETVGEKQRVYGSLVGAYTRLAERRRPDLSAQDERALRERYLAAVNRYNSLLSKLGTAATGATLEELVQLVEQAKQLQAQLAVEQSPELRKQKTEQMMNLFEEAVGGLERLTRAAATKLEELTKKEPDAEAAAHKEWERNFQGLQDRHLRTATEYGRGRYALAKALAPTEEKRRGELLKKVVEDLENLDAEYDGWVYAIVTKLTLANAYTDLKKYAQARQAADAGVALLDEVVRQDPKTKGEMTPWRNRLLAAWAYATAKLDKADKYDEAIARIRDIADHEVEITLAEVYLMKADLIARTGQKPEAERWRGPAKKILERLAVVDPHWQRRAEGIMQRYGLVSTGYLAAFSKLLGATAARNNKDTIRYALELLGCGDVVPAERRSVALKYLAMAYRQEQMFYEAYVVYSHIASSPIAGEEEEQYAGLASLCVQGQFQRSKDAADEVLRDRVARRFDAKYAGPGKKEYGEGGDAKKAKRYEEAVKKFGQVRKESFYYESAAEQKGESYVLWAKEIQKKDPAESDGLLAKGREALEGFLKMSEVASPIPKIVERRKHFRAAAVFRLATIDMWEGKENPKACLERTAEYAKQFPEAAATLYPRVLILRVLALVKQGDAAKVESEFQELRTALRESADQAEAQQLVDFTRDHVFRAYVDSARALQKEAVDKEAEAAKLGDGPKAEELRNEAGEKKGRANEVTGKAIELLRAALAENPEQPYEKFQWLIYELERLQQNNDLRTYLELFLKQFGGRRGLTAKQVQELDKARLTLGITYYRCGEYELAYKALKERFAVMDEAYQRRVAATPKGRPKPEPEPEYWSVLFHIAKSAHMLAEKSGKQGEEAMDIYLRLRDLLEKYSADWWDVMASIAEMRGARGEYAENLLVIGRLLTTRGDLGGRTIRGRYARVLEDICRRERDKDRQQKSINLLVEVQATELEELRKEKRYGDMVRLARDLRLVSVDCGGKPNREKLVAALSAVEEKDVKDEEVRKELSELVKSLKE